MPARPSLLSPVLFLPLLLWLVAAVPVSAIPVSAQAGTIAVTVRDGETGEPLVGAGVRALGPGGTRSGAGVT